MRCVTGEPGHYSHNQEVLRPRNWVEGGFSPDVPDSPEPGLNPQRLQWRRLGARLDPGLSWRAEQMVRCRCGIGARAQVPERVQSWRAPQNRSITRDS